MVRRVERREAMCALLDDCLLRCNSKRSALRCSKARSVLSSNAASSVPQYFSSRRAIHLPIDSLHSFVTLSDNN